MCTPPPHAQKIARKRDQTLAEALFANPGCSTLVTFLHKTFPPMHQKVHIPIAHSHLLVRVTCERILIAWPAFRVGSTSESHWLQSVLVLIVHWLPAPVSVGGLLLDLAWANHGHWIFKYTTHTICDNSWRCTRKDFPFQPSIATHAMAMYEYIILIVNHRHLVVVLGQLVTHNLK